MADTPIYLKPEYLWVPASVTDGTIEKVLEAWGVEGCRDQLRVLGKRQPMFTMESDDEDSGFPLPFRKDGRVNHWYRKWVERMEGRSA